MSCTEECQNRPLTELEEAKLKAEIAKLEAEAERARIDAEVSRGELEHDQVHNDLDLLIMQRQVQQELAKQAEAEFQFVYRFDDVVTATTVDKCQRELLKWATYAEEGVGFEIVINSPGGSVFDGFELGDVIRRVSESGHPVTVRVGGMACSMAGVILQFADHRIIGRHSWLHLHEVSTLAIGKLSDLEDEVALTKRLNEKICKIYAERCGDPDSWRKIYKWIQRHEQWLSAEEALERGYCDEVG